MLYIYIYIYIFIYMYIYIYIYIYLFYLFYIFILLYLIICQSAREALSHRLLVRRLEGTSQGSQDRAACRVRRGRPHSGRGGPRHHQAARRKEGGRSRHAAKKTWAAGRKCVMQIQ